MTTLTTEARDLQVGDRIVHDGGVVNVQQVKQVDTIVFLDTTDGTHIFHGAVPSDRRFAKVVSS